MSIARFCRKHKFPQRRVLRCVKKEILARVDNKTGDWETDCTEEIGVVARHETGATRITYRVTDPDALWYWLAGEIGQSLVNRKQLQHIVRAAREYYRVAMGEHENYLMHHRSTGATFNPNESYFESLDYALELMGG